MRQYKKHLNLTSTRKVKIDNIVNSLYVIYMLNRSYINGHKGHRHYLTDSKILSLQKTISFSIVEEQLVKIIKNLSDPTKLKIYLVLHKVEEIPVTDLTQILHLHQSTVSHALADLKKLGLVEYHRCGQLICYFLSKDINHKILNFLHSLRKEGKNEK